jgi:uncharacterized protein YqgC (DUF456 family)
MPWVIYAIFIAVLLAGVFLNLIGLPGLWVMVGAAVAYGWYTGWQYIGWGTLLALTVIGIIAEVIEFISGSRGAKRAGGSRRAAWGALIGGIVGAIAFSVPVPIIGTTIGLLLGVFAGAVIGEMTLRSEHGHLMRVGWHAAWSRFIAILIKVLFSVIMLGIAAWKALPWNALPPQL